MPKYSLAKVENTQFENDGRVWLRGALSDTDILNLETGFTLHSAPGLRLNNNDTGILETIKNFSKVQAQIDTLLPKSKIVRAVVFDKNADTNWGVPWHQDRVIAVQEKHAVSDFDLWTKKAGLWHVEPPINILKEMIFIRIHLDDSDKSNGCLELSLGSHKYGRIKAQDIEGIVNEHPTEICTARRGDVLIVKALTLHRSLKSNSINSRRALRVDYSNQILPYPLNWAYVC